MPVQRLPIAQLSSQRHFSRWMLAVSMTFWRSGRVRGGQLTTATLPAAETAPTARVDCRRAFLNIVRDFMRTETAKGQLQQSAIGGRGDAGCGAAFTGEANGDFREHNDGSRDCEGVGGAELLNRPINSGCAVLPCKFRFPPSNFEPQESIRHTGSGAWRSTHKCQWSRQRR